MAMTLSVDGEGALEEARELILAESRAIAQVAHRLGEPFVESVRAVTHCEGRVLLTGSGTSATAARRLEHLLCSCGIAAFFMDPANALHGPSAIVSPGDVLLVLSKGGASADVNDFVAVARGRGARIISWTWNPESPLAASSDVVVVLRSGEDAEGEGVLPFGSSLVMGAVGDALCLLARRERGIDLEELVVTHPAGATADLVRNRSRPEGAEKR
jgi:arabinose-5-phosphate isomerase